jgi:uncharacterized protein (TIGR02246 family)
MRRRAVLAGLAVLSAGALAWADQGTADDAKGLDANLAAWVAAFNAHDAKGVAATYAEDADMVVASGERMKGQASIEKGNAEFFAKNPKVQVRLSVLSRRFLKPDVVVEDGAWEESGHTEAGLPTRGLYTTVLVKQQGKWLAVCDRGMVPVSKKP